MAFQRQKIERFTDLVAWQEAHKLVLIIYKIVRKLPKSEVFILGSQLLRAVVSITSNIAEGFSRKTSKEKIQFYFTAKGSLTEVCNQLIIAKDVGYLNENEFMRAWKQTEVVGRLLTGLIRSIR